MSLISHEDLAHEVCLTTHRIDGLVYTIITTPDADLDRIIHPDGTIHPLHQNPAQWSAVERTIMNTLVEEL